MPIRPLTPDDAETYVDLRREALHAAPLAFLSSPETDVSATAAKAREILNSAPNAIVFGAFAPDLVGTLGVRRVDYPKAAHKVNLWGMYVRPDARRRGMARDLLRAGIAHARALNGVSVAHITVSDAAGAAKQLYEAAGFRVWGTEPDAMRHAGRSATEYHMALTL